MDEPIPRPTHDKLSDTELDQRIKEISGHIIEITDSPVRGMAEMEIGRDPDSNATETEFEQGQFIPDEERTVENFRSELRELELERSKRQKVAA